MKSVSSFIKTAFKHNKWLRHAYSFYKLYMASPPIHKVINQDSTFWETSRLTSKKTKVLIATSTGGYGNATTIESVLAIALTLRESDVHFLLCDAALPACQQCIWGITILDSHLVKYGPQKTLCFSCFNSALKIFNPLKLPIHKYSEYLTDQDIDLANNLAATIPFHEISSFKLEGLSVGEHAIAGALRFYAKGLLNNEPLAEPVLRCYFRAALLTVLIVRRLLMTHKYDCVVLHHGIYVPQGLIGEVCRQMSIHVVTWIPAYRKRSFIFSHHDTYHRTLMGESTSLWKNMPWSSIQEENLTHYLKSRWYGTEDWITFHEEARFDLDNISQELKVDFSKPCIGLLTNVMWDAQLHYPANVFPNMLEWLYDTIEYFATRPDLQLIIRIHPAEVNSIIISRQPIAEVIKSRFPVLPSNIHIIPPTSSISTYAVMSQCNTVIIYGTKTGVELSSMSIPVIVAGEAWVRNKGITMDATSREEYLRLLNRLPLDCRLDEATTLRARKYAYHFFFRRMIPLEFAKPSLGDVTFVLDLDTLRSLAVGRSKGLDVICNGILDKTEFIYPAESIQ